MKMMDLLTLIDVTDPGMQKVLTMALVGGVFWGIYSLISNRKKDTTQRRKEIDPPKNNREIWESQLSVASESGKRIIVEFLIKDNISPAKYIENQKAGKYVSHNLQSSLNSIVHENIQATNTYKTHLLLDVNRNPMTPEWFYNAYPDVFVWFNDNDSVFEKEFNALESSLDNMPDEEAQYLMLRFMIDNYKSLFNKLECADC